MNADHRTTFDALNADLSDLRFYRPELDGLRALAVVAVIANHFHQELLPGGYLGVDAFFVVSGFVITSSLVNSQSTTLADLLLGFYARRIKRLVPALVLSTVLSGILICLFDPAPGNTLATGVAALFGLSNLYLLLQSANYFAPSAELNVFTHTWSLGVEEQFYVFFPLLLWLTGYARLTAKGARNLVWLVGTLSVVSLAVFVNLYETAHPVAYFLMPARFWEIGVGCLLFATVRASYRFSTLLASLSPLPVSVAAVAVLFVPVEFGLQATVSIVVLTAILIACLRPGTPVYRLFSHSWAVYVGVISYSLYLWHWVVLSISRWTLGIHWWSEPFQLAAIFILAALSYHIVERPLRRSTWSRDRRRSIGYGVGACLSAAVLLAGLARDGRFYLGGAPPDNKWTGGRSSLSEEQCADKNDSSSLEYQSSCFLPSRSGQTILAIGDSQTAHLIPLLSRINEEDGTGIRFYSDYGHDFPSVAQRRSGETSLAAWQKGEADVRQFLADQSAHLKAGDIILLSSRWELRWSAFPINKSQRDLTFAFYDDAGEQVAKETALGIWKANFKRVIEAAALKGVSVVAFAPIPVWEDDFPPSLTNPTWFNAFNSDVDHIQLGRDFLINHFAATNSALADIKKSHPTFFVFNTFDELCPPHRSRCSPRSDGVVMYRDQWHLSNEGSNRLYPRFREFLRSASLLKPSK